LGIAGIAKSEVSRRCASLDAPVEAFRPRRLEGEYPDVWLDARSEHVREDGRLQSMAAGSGSDGVADGVPADGVREVLGMDVTSSEQAVCGRAFRVPAEPGRRRRARRAAGGQ